MKKVFTWRLFFTFLMTSLNANAYLLTRLIAKLNANKVRPDHYPLNGRVNFRVDSAVGPLYRLEDVCIKS